VCCAVLCRWLLLTPAELRACTAYSYMLGGPGMGYPMAKGPQALSNISGSAALSGASAAFLELI